MQNDWSLHLLPFLGSDWSQCLLEDLQGAKTSLDPPLGQESVCVIWTHWRSNVLLSKLTNGKWTASLLPLQRSSTCTSWGWLQHGGQIQHRSRSFPFWEELHVSLITAMESNVLIWRPNKSQENFSEYKTYTCIPLLHAFMDLFQHGEKVLHFICHLFTDQEQPPHPRNMT